VLDAWKRQQAAKSAAGTDYTAAPDRVSFYDLRQMDKSATPSTPKSDSPVLDFWKRQQAAKSAAGTDYTYALDRVPFTQANAWTGGAAAETKATNLSSAQQSVPWLNTPQYGDDGAVFPTTAAQTGKTGYNGSGGQAGLYRPDTDYTYALDRVPFTQVNTWTGGTETGTKATGRSSAQQPAPWLNTPQYGDDGTVLPQDSSAQGRNALPYDFGDDGTVFSKDKLAQYGSRGYDESIWENNPVRKALRQVALGNYAGETTPLGTALQILAGLAGVDAPADVRDLFYDLTHWEDTAEHRWQLMLDLVAVLPLIGAVKNAGKAGELAQEVLRHGDEISSVLNALPSGADEAAELIGDFAKHSDEAADLARDALKNEDEIQAIINQVFDEEDEFGKTIRNTLDDEDDWLADVTEGAGELGKKTIVIGETMKRVQDYAKTIDAEVYGTFKYYDKIKAIFGEKLANFIGGVDNALWLIDKMVHKYKIVDLGLDVERATRSPYYLMESVLSYLYKYKDYAEDFMKGAF
jgi:hypothetical protein